MLSEKDVAHSCSFRDEEDDCTYRYNVEDWKPDSKVKELQFQVLKKKGGLQV